MKHKTFLNKGVTLIELVVALGLFGVAMTIAGGMVLSVLRAQSRAEAIRATMNNLGFAFEMMSKEIRTGTNFSGIDGVYNYIDFSNAVGDQVVYDSSAGRLYKSCSGGCGGDPHGPLPLTDPKITVTRLRFIIKGGDPNDDVQPQIIVIMGVSYGEKDPSEFHLQTTISQRRIDG